MSDLCCGPDPELSATTKRKPPSPALAEPTHAACGDGCSCCAPSSTQPAPTAAVTAVGDGCGDPTCAAPAPDPAETPRSLWQSTSTRLAILAGLLWLTSEAGDRFASFPAPLVIVLGLGAVAAGGATFVPGTLRALRHGRVGVGTLMTIAVIGAIALGAYSEAGMLAFLFSLAEALEDDAVARTRRGLRALLDLVPATATVVRPGPDGATSEIVVDPAELRDGDLLVVKPGERVATDGIIESGRSSLDTSAITGESVPVEVGPGVEVFAASVNGAGVLTVRVTAGVADNSLARIVHVVEEAQERKGAAQRLAQRIAQPLVPVILVVAAAMAIIGSLLGDPAVWIERALVVLVAASPCAFAISVPVTVIAAIGAATRQGVLVKGGAALEVLGSIDVVALDKTGTLTRNRPAVVATLVAGDSDPADVLTVAAALEARSEHPLAAAVLGSWREANPGRSLPVAEDVQAVVGNGLEGTVDGQPARLGKPGFVAAGQLADQVAQHQDAGATVVLLEREGVLLGGLAIRDELRPEAAEAVGALSAMGIKTVMLTGDNARTAAHLASTAGITEVHAELRPEDKAGLIQTLAGPGSGRRRRKVAMVGDGINDAPALATADVGIAMGAMGTDVAIETADVALMGEDLRALPRSLAHARRSRSIMLQSLALSSAILLVLIPLAAFGVLGLATVIIVHEVAEVFVIANGVRAGRSPRSSRRGRTPVSGANPPPAPAAVSTHPVGAGATTGS